MMIKLLKIRRDKFNENSMREKRREREKERKREREKERKREKRIYIAKLLLFHSC